MTDDAKRTGRPSSFTKETAGSAERMVDIYTLSDPRDGRVRYVGKAVSAERRFAGHLRERRRSTPLYGWVRELAVLGMCPRMTVVERCSEAEWQQVERRHIAGTPGVLNVAPGGNQPFCPPDVRARNGKSVAAMRDRRKWALLQKMGSALSAGTVSESTKAKMRARMDVFGQFAGYL